MEPSNAVEVTEEAMPSNEAGEPKRAGEDLPGFGEWWQDSGLWSCEAAQARFEAAKYAWRAALQAQADDRERTIRECAAVAESHRHAAWLREGDTMGEERSAETWKTWTLAQVRDGILAKLPAPPTPTERPEAEKERAG